MTIASVLARATTGVFVGATVFATSVAAQPVPSLPQTGGVPAFLGAPAIARPVRGVAAVPQNGFLAPNGDSNIHGDGWMSDTYTRPGPLGRDPEVDSLLLGGECASLAFDRAGRIVTTCLGLTAGVYLIDPATMRVLGNYRFVSHSRTEHAQPGGMGEFTGGAYFFLDNQDRVVVGAGNGHVLVLAENPAADGFSLRRDYDLTGVLRPGEQLNSVLPDSNGLLWFVTKTDGVVGTLDQRTGAAHTLQLGNGTQSEIENSFAVGASGDVYIATNRELLRMDANTDAAPTVTWRIGYPNIGRPKPGQIDDGTGTTPTVLPGGYVAITDNADPMDVTVYRTDPLAARRLVCSMPVFARGASATENSLIGAGNSLIVENNYGYSGQGATMFGGTTTAGFARIDIDPDGSGCHLVWSNTSTAAPSVVPKLSLATGLIYTYTKGAQPTDPWYWTALDFRTGKPLWQRLSGSGPLFNNNYAGIALGPDGAAYLGVQAGLVRLRDTR